MIELVEITSYKLKLKIDFTKKQVEKLIFTPSTFFDLFASWDCLTVIKMLIQKFIGRGTRLIVRFGVRMLHGNCFYGNLIKAILSDKSFIMLDKKSFYIPRLVMNITHDFLDKND